MNIRVELVGVDELAERIAEILAAKLDRVAPRQRGSEHYARDERPDPGAGTRYHGPGFVAVTDDGLEPGHGDPS
jgi:hypothetical protein